MTTDAFRLLNSPPPAIFPAGAPGSSSPLALAEKEPSKRSAAAQVYFSIRIYEFTPSYGCKTPLMVTVPSVPVWEDASITVLGF